MPSINKPYSVLTEEDINSAKNLRVLIAHSPNDLAVKYENGKKAKKKLKKAGYNVLFQSYEGGHSVPPKLMKIIAKWVVE